MKNRITEDVKCVVAVDTKNKIPSSVKIALVYMHCVCIVKTRVVTALHHLQHVARVMDVDRFVVN